jgi:hypothetical protein
MTAATHLTRIAAAQAFELWENEFRATPEGFYTPEEAAAMEVASLAESRAIALFAYLRQGAAGITPPSPGQYWAEQAAWYAGPVAYPDGRVITLLLPDGFDAIGKLAWGKYGKAIKGAESLHDGVANTAAMAKAGSAAAKAVLAHNPDWYLPSRIEALQLFAMLKAQVGEGRAWSSTQCSAHYAWSQFFAYGYQGTLSKDAELRAVAVRRLVLQSFGASNGGAA